MKDSASQGPLRKRHSAWHHPLEMHRCARDSEKADPQQDRAYWMDNGNSDRTPKDVLTIKSQSRCRTQRIHLPQHLAEVQVKCQNGRPTSARLRPTALCHRQPRTSKELAACIQVPLPKPSATIPCRDAPCQSGGISLEKDSSSALPSLGIQ